MTAASDPTERPRALDVRPENIPDDLQRYPHWVVWAYTWDDDREEWAKRPYDAETGDYASTTASETWTTFARALGAHENGERRTDGVGFVLTDSPFSGTDFDNCRDPQTEQIESWADEAIRTLDSYAEVSPSATGTRGILRTDLPDGRRRRGDVEMYDTGRYLTITGHTLDGHDTIRDGEQAAAALAEVHAEHIAADDPDEPDESAQDARGERGGGDAVDSTAGDADAARAATRGLSNDDLLNRARNAENGEKFARLWRGDTSGYPSSSEADLALCSLLAFWTGGDPARVDDLFRQSALMRPKWDADRGSMTYGERTITHALDGQTEFYDPTASGSGGSGSDDLTHTASDAWADLRSELPESAPPTAWPDLLAPVLTELGKAKLAGDDLAVGLITDEIAQTTGLLKSRVNTLVDHAADEARHTAGEQGAEATPLDTYLVEHVERVVIYSTTDHHDETRYRWEFDDGNTATTGGDVHNHWNDLRKHVYAATGVSLDKPMVNRDGGDWVRWMMDFLTDRGEHRQTTGTLTIIIEELANEIAQAQAVPFGAETPYWYGNPGVWLHPDDDTILLVSNRLLDRLAGSRDVALNALHAEMDIRGLLAGDARTYSAPGHRVRCWQLNREQFDVDVHPDYDPAAEADDDHAASDDHATAAE